MHEMALTHDVLDTVIDYAQKAGVKKVTAVYLTVGYGRDIVDDLFDGCFKYLAKGTVAQDAELVVFRVPVTVRCKSCGKVYPINMYRKDTWPCPYCKAQDYVCNTGFEFTIDHIDVVRDEVLQA